MDEVKNIKRQRFKKVAGKRVQKILDDFDSLSKCSNRSNYEYDKADVVKMLNVIKEKLKILEAVYSNNIDSNRNKFQF